MPDGPSPRVAADDPGAIAEATAVLASGGAVILPTDTVYGLAALPTVAGATDALFELKERGEHQPLAVLVADIEQALALVEAPAEVVERWMAELWPGPLTLVLPRSELARQLPLGGDDATIGVRCPDHPFVRAVAAELGPIATTSANRSGEATPTSAQGAADALSGAVSLIVDGGPAGTVASTVVDATSSDWRVLREGAISAERLEAVAGGVARAGEAGSH